MMTKPIEKLAEEYCNKGFVTLTQSEVYELLLHFGYDIVHECIEVVEGRQDAPDALRSHYQVPNE